MMMQLPELVRTKRTARFSEIGVVASLCKDSFFDFVREFWHVIVNEIPIFNWHVEYLCQELQLVAERVFRGEAKKYDLVINVPPGSTKSTIVSQMFPAWVWCRMPAAKFICASYAHMIAQKDSLRTRDLVKSDLYRQCFPNLELREDENTKGLFVNTKTGFRLAAGVGGAITGLHGHFIITDDPLNPEQAYSDSELRTVNRWFETTLPSRKIDKRVTPTIIVQQRLHQYDPSGEMLARDNGSGGVRHICLPGEIHESINPPELKSRYVDGLLDPVRLPREVLEDMRKNLGEYGYAAQILQDPVPLGGGWFKTDRIRLVPNTGDAKFVRKVRSWDKAGTKDGGMYSVGVLMGEDKHRHFWVLDVKRGQWDARQREDKILETAEEDGLEVETIVEIEGGSGGKESGESTISNLAGYRVVAYHPTGDKESRAYPFASQVGGGNVSCLIKPWTREYLDELRHFPKSKYKDQVDASSGAFNRLARKRRRIGAF